MEIYFMTHKKIPAQFYIMLPSQILKSGPGSQEILQNNYKIRIHQKAY